LRPTEFVNSYFDAWNHHDARLVAEHLANNGTYCDVPEDQQHSRDEFLGYLVDFFTLNEHSYQLVGEVLTGKDTIAFQYAVSMPGSSSGPFFGAEFVTMNGAEAVKILDYYDISNMVRPAVLASENKYTKSGLSGDRIEQHKRRLNRLMQFEKVYRQPDLTLPKLAVMVNCSVNHLSQVINSGIGISFFDYLNQHRVEYAKKLLQQPVEQQRSILSVALTAGFNSNSSFYTAFKKASQQTPAQYRKEQLKNKT
jgi:AraC-like DNA-binding protein